MNNITKIAIAIIIGGIIIHISKPNDYIPNFSLPTSIIDQYNATINNKSKLEHVKNIDYHRTNIQNKHLLDDLPPKIQFICSQVLMQEVYIYIYQNFIQPKKLIGAQSSHIRDIIVYKNQIIQHFCTNIIHQDNPDKNLAHICTEIVVDFCDDEILSINVYNTTIF